MGLKTIKPLIGGMAPMVKPMPKLADALYTSPEWRGLVKRIKAKRGPYCERCGSSHRVIGDHIIEVKDGGAPLDEANVELLCAAHHNAKTAKARGERARGQR